MTKFEIHATTYEVLKAEREIRFARLLEEERAKEKARQAAAFAKKKKRFLFF